MWSMSRISKWPGTKLNNKVIKTKNIYSFCIPQFIRIITRVIGKNLRRNRIKNKDPNRIDFSFFTLQAFFN